MPKKAMSAESRAQVRQMRGQLAKNKTAMKEIADKMKAEKRGYSDEEKTKMEQYRTENQQLSASIEAMESPEYDAPAEVVSRNLATAEILFSLRNKAGVPDKYAYLRAGNNPFEMIIPNSEMEADEIMKRAAGDVQSLSTVTPLVPITIKDIVEPLSHLLIYDKVGLRIQHGIEGQWNFPVVSGIEATFLGENVQVTDTKIELSKITPTPKRYSVSVPVSNLAIIQSNGGIRNIVINGITLAVANLINKVTFSTTQVGTAGVFPTGCFVGCVNTPAANTAFTYKEVVALKYTIIGRGVQGWQYGCYVCTPKTYAELATTPKDAGSGRFILENGMIDGTPVFMTVDFDDTKLGFGIFSYNVAGFFGQQTLGVDGTSHEAFSKSLTWFMLNGYMDLACLRTEAFGTISKTNG